MKKFKKTKKYFQERARFVSPRKRPRVGWYCRESRGGGHTQV